MRDFIKKHIILKKRKPTDSIFAEKRSAVAITFALMVPVLFAMLAIMFNLCAAYYVEELASMGLDGAATVLSTAGYQNAMNDYQVRRNAQIVLSTTVCQYLALYNCWGGQMGILLPNNVSAWRWVKVGPYGGIIQAKAYLTGILPDMLGAVSISKNWTSLGLTARAEVRFLNSAQPNK